MRRFWRFTLALTLALTPMMARAGDGPENVPAERDSSAASPELSALELEIGELRDLLAGQARQIEEQGRLLQRSPQPPGRPIFPGAGPELGRVAVRAITALCARPL